MSSEKETTKQSVATIPSVPVVRRKLGFSSESHPLFLETSPTPKIPLRPKHSNVFTNLFEVPEDDDALLLCKPPSEEDEEEGLFKVIHTTFKLERLIWIGVALCLDQLLTLVTVLPFRLLYCVFFFPRSISQRSRVYFDVSMVFILLVSLYILLHFVSAAQVYHSLRLQTFMKLYVVVNIAEILDRLLCSLGIDLFEFLAESIQRRRVWAYLLHLFLCTVYTCVHSSLFYIRVLTLSVALNSSNDALFTILVSNNFVELKGAVFKRSSDEILMQISFSDIGERFTLMLFLILVGLNEFSGGEKDVPNFLLLLLGVLGIEMAVDWVKHSFICRYNPDHILSPIQTYDHFLAQLADAYFVKAKLFLYPHVSKRVALPILPLGVVLIRVLVFDVPERSALFIVLLFGMAFALKHAIKFLLLHAWFFTWWTRSILLPKSTISTPSTTPHQEEPLSPSPPTSPAMHMFPQISPSNSPRKPVTPASQKRIKKRLSEVSVLESVS